MGYNVRDAGDMTWNKMAGRDGGCRNWTDAERREFLRQKFGGMVSRAEVVFLRLLCWKYLLCCI